MGVTCLSARLRLSPFVLVCMTVTVTMIMIVVRPRFLVRMGMPGLMVIMMVRTIMVMMMPGMGLDMDLSRRHPAADHALGAEVYLVAAGELLQVGGDFVERAAGVNQAAEDHVARRAGETVEKHDAVGHCVVGPLSLG